MKRRDFLKLMGLAGLGVAWPMPIRQAHAQDAGYSGPLYVSIAAMGGWDVDLKLNEHWDFFLRFKQAGLRVAYCPDVRLRNWEDDDAWPEEYTAFRRRDYTGVACHKHGIRVLRDMGGRTRYFGPPDA